MVGMARIMVFDRLDNYLFDIEPKQVMDAPYIEEINREHSLTITTFQGLEKTNRLLICDGMGIWHEYVVLGASETHESAIGVVRDYYCIWSLQYDLMCTFINGPYDCGIVPGHASIPQTATTAMNVALGGTSRWTVGTITVTTMAAASFYRQSGWEGLQTVIEKWGGEIQATITVDSSGVVSRTVDLLTHIGNSQATRRFDFTHDVTKIKRTVSDDVWPCRIVPLGKSQETEAGGYTRRPDITSVNDGVMWLQDDEVVPYTYTTNPDGEYEYPIIIVENDTYEQPSDLKAWAIAHISDYTRPKVTYEASVLQFAKAGLNPHGVALGDNVVVVDRTYGDDGLRINARVTKIAGNMLDSSDTKLTIGNISESLTNQLASVSRQVAQVSDIVSRSQQFQASAEYLSNLINRLNTGINATGGYTYITEGEGLRTYDRPVSNPLVGSEATQVVEVKGGTIRIANSRTSGGDWDWKTMLVSGHIAAELVTAVRVVAGYIGNAGSSYWDLDNGELVIAPGASLGDKTVQQVLDGVDATITNVDVEYAQATSATTAPTTGWSTTPPAWEGGKYIWSRTVTTTGTGTSAITSYSTPVMISGKDGVDGQDGDDGVGITSIVPQYYLSTSNSTPTGGSWSSNEPTWESGKYIWTCSLIMWDTTPASTTTTTPVLANALNGANSTAKSAKDTADAASNAAADAAKVATNYLTFSSSNGLDVGYSGTNAKTRIKGDNVEIFDGDGYSLAFFGKNSNKAICRIGKQSGSGNIFMSDDGYVDVRSGSIIVAHFGYGSGKDITGTTSNAPYYDLGIRSDNNNIGNYSTVVGYNCKASGFAAYAEGYNTISTGVTHAEGTGTTAEGNGSHAEGEDTTASGYGTHAEGWHTTATGNSSHAEGAYGDATGDYSHVEGWSCDATGDYTHAEGKDCTASANYSHAGGRNAVASGSYSFAHGYDIEAAGYSQVVFGQLNVVDSTSYFIVGHGMQSSARRNMLLLDYNGNLWIAGTLTQNSDRRLKEHHAYLGEDACEFIRNLKPALFSKDGQRHTGFYAQDVKNAEPDGWDTVTVETRHTDEGLDFDPLTLDYTALIAPLVAYCQQLERRIAKLEKLVEGGER